MPFEPGQSGNPGGRPKQAKQFRDALLRALEKADLDGKRLDRVAEKLVSNAVEGETAAIREIADRIDGKVPQAVAANITNEKHEDWLERLGAESSPAAESGPAAILAAVPQDQDQDGGDNAA